MRDRARLLARTDYVDALGEWSEVMTAIERSYSAQVVADAIRQGVDQPLLEQTSRTLSPVCFVCCLTSPRTAQFQRSHVLACGRLKQ